MATPVRKGFRFNQLRELHAALGALIVESDVATAAYNASQGDEDAPAPAAMDSAPSASQHERDMQAHYATMDAITPHASRIWKARR